MRFTIAVFSCAASVATTLVPARASAVETRADVETDHIDAADDGGPRSLGVVVHPLFMAARWLGAEVDAACGERAVVTVEGDGRWGFGARAVRASLGVAFYPQRFSFHGIYVHPAIRWEQVTVSGVVSSAVGGGVTVGYAWTWPVGASVRFGGGMAYSRGVATGGGTIAGLAGLTPQVDGDVGWVF